MGLFFSNGQYKERAMRAVHKQFISQHSIQDALLLLLEDVPADDLTNLCEEIQKQYRENGYSVDLSIEECYSLTQCENIDGKVEFSEDAKNIIYTAAYACLENRKPLGNKTIMDGKINTSEWLGHSLLEGKLAGELATMCGLDTAMAQKLGILHDYGRKTTHSFEHVPRGYEALSDRGWNYEAIGCLTHSFLAGGRCACNDQAEEGFYVDDNGEPHWREGTKKDDLTLFLEEYTYTKYDDILNIADLMATSYAIVSPAERIADIAIRRKEFDPTNRSYFLAEFTNKLIEMLADIGGAVPEDMNQKVKAAKGVTLEEITQKFERASELFFDEYQHGISIKPKRQELQEKIKIAEGLTEKLLEAQNVERGYVEYLQATKSADQEISGRRRLE